MTQITIDFQLAVDSDELPSADLINHWVSTTLSHAGYKQSTAELTVRVVSAIESQQLNSEYRGKDKPTNVLSFPFDIPEGIPGELLDSDLLGDLIICHQVVKEEAQQQQKSIQDHYAHMLVHGTLHLLGFDHIDDEEADEMESLETQILASMSIADPYL